MWLLSGSYSLVSDCGVLLKPCLSFYVCSISCPPERSESCNDCHRLYVCATPDAKLKQLFQHAFSLKSSFCYYCCPSILFFIYKIYELLIFIISTTHSSLCPIISHSLNFPVLQSVRFSKLTLCIVLTLLFISHSVCSAFSEVIFSYPWNLKISVHGGTSLIYGTAPGCY